MESSPVEYDVMVDRDVMMKARDGVKLVANLYRPARNGRLADGRFPVILIRTSYDKDVTPETNLDCEYFVKRGYVIVVQDVRGRYKSEGSFYHGVTEAEDGYDTVEWIARQHWSNGKIGMTGISYLAAVQCAVAVANAPHIASIFHVKAPSNYYQNGDRHGGTFLMYMMPIVLMFSATSREAMADPVIMKAVTEAKAREWLTRMPLRKGLSPLALVPDCENWLLDMMNHTDYDEYWKRVPLWQPEDYFDRYADVPGYYLGGWYDMYSEDTFWSGLANRKSKPIKLLMGPWTHMDTERFAGDVDFGPDAAMTFEEYNALQLRWFDQTLKGMSDGILEEPPIRIFVMGGGDGRKNNQGRMNHGGKWRFENEWPIARIKYTAYYIRAGGILGTSPPERDEPPSTYIYDPKNPVPTIGGTSYFVELVPRPGAEKIFVGKRVNRFVEPGPRDQRERPDLFGCRTSLPLSSRHDVLVFATPPLTDDAEVTGPLTVKLWASSSAVDTDFTAKLIDVHPPNIDYPEGYEMNLSDSIIRARYRNTFERSELMRPGDVYEFTITLPSTSNLFVKGHQMRLDISSSNYPTYDANPNTGEPYMRSGKTIIAENTIYHDADHPSRIILPIIPHARASES